MIEQFKARLKNNHLYNGKDTVIVNRVVGTDRFITASFLGKEIPSDWIASLEKVSDKDIRKS